MKSCISKRITAIVLIICMAVTLLPPSARSVMADDLEYRPGGVDIPVDRSKLVFIGALNTFNINNGDTVTDNDPFSFDIDFTGIDIPAYRDEKFFLVPYDSGNGAESILGTTYCVDPRVLSRICVGRAGQLTSFEAESAVVGVDRLGNTQAVVPSGAYYLGCMLDALPEDVGPYASDAETDAESDAESDAEDKYLYYYFLSMYPFRYSNSSDGGYISDEFYGVENLVATLVEPVINVGGGVCTNAKVTVYSSDLKICYGTAPCIVPIGAEVKLDVVPCGEDEYLAYSYDFPGISKGNPYESTVPDNGKIEINVSEYESVEFGGVVSDENGSPISGAEVSVTFRGGKDEAHTKTTDSFGEFLFTDIYAESDATVIVSKAGYLTESVTVKAKDLIDGNVNLKLVLKTKRSAFTLRAVKPDYMTDACFAAFTCKLRNCGLRAIDEITSDFIYGDFSAAGTGIIVFSPERSDGIVGGYKVELPDFCSESEVSAKLGGTADIRPAFESAIILNAAPDGDETQQVKTLLFDKDGNVQRACETGVGESVIFLVNAGSYRVVSFMSDERSILERINTYSELSLLSDSFYEKEITLEKGEAYTESDIDVPYVSETEESILQGSFANIKTENGVITVNGRIELKKGDGYTIDRLKIYACSVGSSDAYNQITAVYKDDSLVMNGKSVKADLLTTGHYSELNKYIELDQPQSGPANFSCKLGILRECRMYVVVAADVTTKEGDQYSDQNIAFYELNESGVTLTAHSKTASGSIKCKGNAPADGTVYIYDGTTCLSKVLSDKYGSYEVRVTLPESNTSSKTHKLTAVCGAESSTPVYVTFDPDATAVTETEIVSDGSILPATYVWTERSSFAFRTEIENAQKITGDTSFSVMCSDGTIVSIPAYFLKEYSDDTGVDKAVYTCDEYPFGPKSLVPVKVWFDYENEAGDEDDNVIFEAALEPYTAPDGLTDEELGAQRTENIISREQASDAWNMTATCEKAQISDYVALVDRGGKVTCVKDASGNMIYEICYLSTDGEEYWARYDQRSGEVQINTLYVYTSDDYPEKLDSLYQKLKMPQGADPVVSAEGAKAPIWTAADASVYADTSASSNYISGATVQSAGEGIVGVVADEANDYAMQMLSKTAKYGKYAELERTIGLGGIMGIGNIGKAAYDCGLRNNYAYECKYNLYKLQHIAETLESKGYNVTRAKGAINESLNCQRRLDDMTVDYFNSVLGSELWAFSTGKLKGIGKIVGAGGKFIGDEMLKEQWAHVESSYAEAQETYTEALRRMQLATGLSLNDLYALMKESKDGSIPKDFMDKIKSALDDDNNGDDFNPVIDPSGYVYEAVASNRIEGATVTLYKEGMELFEAGAYSQQNPILTDAYGSYAWDVPEGNWFVSVYKDGYEIGSSQYDPAATVAIAGVNYLPVLPPQLDVNIAINSAGKATAKLVKEGGEWYLVFSRYVQTETVAGNITCDQIGDFSFEAVDAEQSPAQTPVCGGKMLATKFRLVSNSFEKESAFTLRFGEGLLAYNGTHITGAVSTGNDNPNDPGIDPGITVTSPSSPAVRIAVIVITAVAAGMVIAAGVTVAIVLKNKNRRKQQ